MGEPGDREFLLGVFLMEAWETVATLEEGAARFVEAGGTEAGSLDPLLLVTHRLNGAAALHGFPRVAEAARLMEQLLERTPGMSEAERRQVGDCLRELVACLKKVLDGIASTRHEDVETIAAFTARHAALLSPAPSPRGPAAPPPGPVAAPDAQRLLGEMGRFFSENPEILAYFGPEAAEHLETMTKSLLALERTGRSEAELGEIFRAVHTLKGAAYTVGCAPLGDLAHKMEDLLVAVREERIPFAPTVIEGLFAGVDALKLLLGSTEGLPANLQEIVERTLGSLNALMPASLPEPPSAQPVEAEAALAPEPTAGVTETPAGVGSPADRTQKGRSQAPGVSRRSIRVNLDRLDSLMNLVGELVIARSRLERRILDLDRVGELLSSSRSRMAQVVKEFETKYLTPLPPVAGSQKNGTARPDSSLIQRFEELEFDRYDDFNILARSVGEISADVSEVQTLLAGLIRSVHEDSAQIQRLTGELRNAITRTRMVPIGTLFARFARQVREAAKAAGKAVALEVSGESVEVDNTIIEQIADPLLHLIQNAISHGIETEAERQAGGKPPQGTVFLRAYQQGGSIYIEVEDDGRGIDLALLRERAMAQGLLRPDAASLLSDRSALDLIFLPGFSTAPSVTTASGRGVGMDVVRTNVSRLSGEIDVETEVGVGTRFTIKLPLTVAISDALMVRSGTETLALPVSAIKVVLAVRPEEMAASGGDLVRVEDEFVDLIRLREVLGLPPSEADGRIPVVVVRAGWKSFAVAVDELLGKTEIVVKSLGDFLEGVEPFAGATISGEGRVILLVDPARLLDAGRGAGSAATEPPSGLEGLPPASTRPQPDEARRVLLVDDSISVRKFVGQMLERAGFHVLTANDGEDALRTLDETSVHAVITDLEMPRVNGYELIRDLRRRLATRDLPVVVLTTRAGAKHMDLARQLGVKHYVTKPIEEHAFVRLIDSLVARAPAAAGLAGSER